LFLLFVHRTDTMGQLWTYMQDFASNPLDTRVSKFKLYSKQAKGVCAMLRIDSDALRDLFDFFNYLDRDQSGKIGYYEFLDQMHLKDSKMMERLFRMFDTDETGDVDFKEFLIQLWNIVTRTERMLVQLLFDIFDEDDNEFLSPAECVSLLKMILGEDSEQFDREHLQQLLNRIDADHDGQISFDELVAFCNVNALFIEPIRDLQRRLRHSVCGPEHWQTMSEWRILQFGPKADVATILDLNAAKGSQLKKMRDTDNISQLEDKRQEMMLAQADKANQLIARTRRMTEREIMLLVIYSSRCHVLEQQSLHEEMSDIELQRNLYKRGQLTANIQELYADMDTVFELEFKKIKKDSAAAAEQSAVDFLASPIGNNVVAAAADALVAKAKQDASITGNRLPRADAEQLVRSKLKDTLLTQVWSSTLLVGLICWSPAHTCTDNLRVEYS
jgi:serine/threonine-protein phosphatase 2B regulatory subunit